MHTKDTKKRRYLMRILIECTSSFNSGKYAIVIQEQYSTYSALSAWCLVGMEPSSSRQLTRKASPMFLFAAPPKELQNEWTTAAIRFVKTNISSCRHSVASVKPRMSQNKKIHDTTDPCEFNVNIPLLCSFKLFRIISTPADP